METVNFIKLFKDLKSTGEMSDEDILYAEKSLNLNFSEEYKAILKKLGATRFNGIELNGLTKAPALNVVEETKSYREFNDISNNLYVISSLGIDDIKIMQNEKGEVFQCYFNKVEKIANSIFNYLLIDIKNNITIKSLMNFLEKLNIPHYEYSVGYAEDAICIEKEEDNWIVYDGERGNKFQLKRFNNEQEACIEFLTRELNYALRDQ